MTKGVGAGCNTLVAPSPFPVFSPQPSPRYGLTRVSCALGASCSFKVVYEHGEYEAAKDPSNLRPMTTEETELPRSTLYGRLVYHSSPGSEVDLSAAAVRALGGETH